MKVVFAGSTVVDHVKRMESYPALGNLSIIRDVSFSIGGSVCNSGIDLKVLDPSVDVSAIGKIGHDEEGKYILSMFEKYGIHSDWVTYSEDKMTSYTDVMLDKYGRRTFFQYPGACGEFSPADIPLDKLDCDRFHIGYALLLDTMDSHDDEYGTKMARVLADVQKKGIKTSIDVVSEEGDRYATVVGACLPYVTDLIINEIEGGKTVGIDARDENGKVTVERIQKICTALLEAGVNHSVTIHCPELAVMVEKNGRVTVVPSFPVAKEDIVSTTGAGDAFLAGCLYGIDMGYSPEDTLKIAHYSATNNLFASDCVSGAKSLTEMKWD